MAADALDILTLEEAKAELRIEDGDSTHDELITAQIRGAVSYVSTVLRAPLVDSVFTYYCSSPGDDHPLAVPTDYVRSVAPIRYWRVGTALRDEPDGTIAVADLGRQVQIGNQYCVWPPAGGWPEIEPQSLFEVDLTRGITITPWTQSLRDAVVVVLRLLYGGEPRLLPKATIHALIHPWRREGAELPGTLVTRS